MDRRTTFHAMLVLILASLLRTSICTDEGNSTSIEVPERKALILSDVPSAKAFIDSTDIAVVGFFTDLDEPEIEYFETLVKNHPEWDFGTSTTPAVLKHFKIRSNTVTIFRKADNWRDDLVVKENEGINTAKMYRFLSINELRLVADYNPMTSIGIIACKVQIHLLFFTDKDVYPMRFSLRGLLKQ
ncbi:endoplasmic reticulum resident protein 27 [Pyxicephalus adspersus]|uniref:endoplasmic reticulum resident protein 27 n=1 Tax=Pyxicephalus adspersus TaxID=30357 RepID=UPI003B5AC23F